MASEAGACVNVWTSSRGMQWALWVALAGSSAGSVAAQGVSTAALNRTPAVQDAFAHFYDMDYDGALDRFEKVAAQHPDDPLATDYVLYTVTFKELNRLDLLDTTFYANDGFLTGKHTVSEDPAIKQKIEELTGKANDQANARLTKNGRDVDALYARGWASSLDATYQAMVERSFTSALRLALRAKNDHQGVLDADSRYVDANLVVGTYQYVVGALPLSFRLLIGIAGIHGSKEKGMEMLSESAKNGVLTSVESQTCMMLFFRRQGDYAEAEKLARGLAQKYPHDYLFQLEEANLLKDNGNGPAAIAQYQAVLSKAQTPGYFHSARLELAYFGLGDTLRGQKRYADAATAYRKAAFSPTATPELKQRCLVNAGKSFDLLHDRDRAMQNYQAALGVGADTVQGQEAQKWIKRPYTLS